MMKNFKIIFVLFFVFQCVTAQKNIYKPQIWGLLNYGGNVGLSGDYSISKTNFNSNMDETESISFSGNIDLNTTSFFWHPNFVIFNLGGSYFPNAQQLNYLSRPDAAQEIFHQKIGMSALFFREKPLKIKPFLNYANSFSNAENLSEIESYSLNYGSYIEYYNKLIPIFIYYNKRDENTEDLTFNRIFKTQGYDFNIKSKMNYDNWGEYEIRYNNNKILNSQIGIYEVENKTSIFSLRGRAYLDKKDKVFLSSNINNTKRVGSGVFDNLAVTNLLSAEFPRKVYFFGDYSYRNFKSLDFSSINNSLKGKLNHTLYESLNTGINANIIRNKHSSFIENRESFGFDINYTKKIPLNGRLRLNYKFDKEKYERDSYNSNVEVIDQQYTLEQGEIILIEYPNVIRESITVKDRTGTIFYQENVDYILIWRGAYFEIMRLPGGLIPNGGQIFLDFVFENNSDFKYTNFNNVIISNISFFNNLVQFYYNYYKYDYDDIEINPDFNLNYVRRNVIGFKFGYKNIYLGGERDNYKSSINPYILNSYFVSFHSRLLRDNKLSIQFNADVKDYEMIMEEGREQLFVNVNGLFNYYFDYSTSLNIKGTYRKQRGEEIDLDLFIGDIGFEKKFNKLWVNLNVNFYKKKYSLNSINNFYRVNFKISRLF